MLGGGHKYDILIESSDLSKEVKDVSSYPLVYKEDNAGTSKHKETQEGKTTYRDHVLVNQEHPS